MRGTGRAIFVAILLLIVGTLNVIYGIGAISDSHLAIGGAYPFWALGAFAICIICIHGLVVLGEPEEARS